MDYSYFLLAFLSVVNCEWNTNDYLKREHSLMKPYTGSGLSMPFWDFLGSTVISSNYIRLTSDLQSKSGAIWNIVPCKSKNWELQVQFKVHGHGKDLFGDGLAFWYARDRMVKGPVFGSKDYFYGLAIILDTYSNHNGPHNHAHPYISAMVNNGTLYYDHDRDGTHTQLAGCEARFRNVEHETYLAVRYENDKLSVSTDIDNKAGWKPCFTVEGVRLPTGYYFGMSATTGDLSDNHDIIAVKLYELDDSSTDATAEDRSNIMPAAQSFEPPREHVDDPKPSSMGGVKLFLFMLLGVLGVFACIVVGIIFYQRQQEKSRKRFY
ncbi:vesicular integral-membrane protein VIP36-like [Daphnia pulicaria]|uniref:vesicular integral-membrane protein VIP36-like n=1 Tax=Daphnia pulicaria TaxID=35523 RepID=UPI001EE9C2FA|nr:vesicular integral-membrane protein VIP36-like [Daphnia pulicaria]